jgi:ribosomal protein S18 acetylase RimI-like enzyme
VPLLWWAPGDNNPLLLTLRRSGFEYADTLVGMHAKVHNLLEQNATLVLPAGCEFEQVASPQAEVAWNQVVASTFDLPLFYGELFLKASKCFIHNGREPTSQVYALNFLLKQEGKPMGAASVFFGHGVVDFYNVAILPEYQGKGLGRHLMLGCLQAIAARGRQEVVLNATAAGQPLYQSLGFEPVLELLRLQWYPK